MIHELAVIAIGDLEYQDQGISIYLLESLQQRFAEKQVKFIKGGVDGRDLFESLQHVTAKKVIVLDVAETVTKPGRLNYLTLTPAQAETLKELTLITIEPFKTGKGTRLSFPLIKRYNHILSKIESVINEMLTGPLAKC